MFFHEVYQAAGNTPERRSAPQRLSEPGALWWVPWLLKPAATADPAAFLAGQPAPMLSELQHSSVSSCHAVPTLYEATSSCPFCRRY